MTFLLAFFCVLEILFLDIFRKHSHKKSNFVEESLDAELNVIWIPAHFWNTHSERAEAHVIFILIALSSFH